MRHPNLAEQEQPKAHIKSLRDIGIRHKNTMTRALFHLVSLQEPKDPALFIQALRSLPIAAGLLWAGHCEHWIHQPELSKEFASGTELRKTGWDYLLVCRASETDSLGLPPSISEFVVAKWSIVNEVSEPLMEDLPSKAKNLPGQLRTELPFGWSSDNHGGLNASTPPEDLNLSLKTTSQPLRAGESAPEIELRSFVRTFGSTHSGPIAMFNLLSIIPGQLEQYFKYISAFGEVSYGGEPLIFGFEIETWTSKADSASDWDGAALVWYPSIWNFAKMLDDPRYADLDRKYKIGVIRDNPVLCCVKVEL
jgi:hypothetical protein